ncbi:MAG: T9SS type A sorting domain-containing protein [Flavobacteriales bacterium]
MLAAQDNEWIKVYSELGQRNVVTSHFVVDDQNFVYSANESALNAGEFACYLTKFSPSGGVVKEIKPIERIIQLQIKGDSLFVCLVSDSGEAIPTTFYSRIYDLELNELVSSSYIDSTIDYVEEANAGNEKHWSSVFAINADSLEGEFYQTKLAFVHLDEGGLIDTITWFNELKNARIGGFSPRPGGYLAMIEFEDSIITENILLRPFQLDEGLEIVQSIDEIVPSYPLDTSGFTSISRINDKSTSIQPISSSSFILGLSSACFYQFPDASYQDWDAFIAKFHYSNQNFSDYTVVHNVNSNSFLIRNQIALAANYELLTVDTRDNSEFFGFYESSDSYIVLSRFDSNLNLIWESEFFKNDGIHQRAEWIQEKPDGHVVAMGTQYNWNTGESEIFMIQTDSNGLVDDTVGAIELLADDWNFGPNPILDQLYIYSTNNSKWNTYSLYDLNGRWIRDYIGNGIHSTADLNLGCYILKSKSNPLVTRKVIKIN